MSLLRFFITTTCISLLFTACGSEKGPNGNDNTGLNQNENKPSEDEIEPTLSSIKKNIISVRCQICHSPGGKADHIPLITHSDFVDSPREIVLPGNPDESGIIIAISKTDDDRMPPPSTGDPLTDKQIDAIYKWIKDGALDN